MKKTIRFSKLFLPAAIFSICLMVASVASYFVMGGFNLGVDFKAGLIQEVQLAPTAFSLTWTGRGNARVGFDSGGIDIIHSVGVDSRTVPFPLNEYRTVGALAQALESGVEGISVELTVPESVSSELLIRSAQGDTQLGNVPYLVHYLNTQGHPPVDIATVREALGGLDQTVSVQSLGQPSDRKFMIRVEGQEEGGGASGVMIADLLEKYFGEGEVVILSSSFVDSRFSKNLTDQVGLLVGLTLLVMLVYVTVRFKPQYGIGLIIGIIHDGLVVVAFVIWTGMEFNTTTIAAILTIVGYSTNNTIVVFDRIREVRRIYPEESLVNVLDMSITATLNRTIITTFTTMLAVMSLFIFTTGSMRDFALALQIGMISGVYTTTFIASGFVNFWENQKIKKEKMKLTGQAPARIAKA